MKNVSTSVKELLNVIKQDKNPLPIEKVLKTFLLDMKQLSESSLKEKLTNSGLFLESKLKNAQNPQLELKETLKTLQDIVQKSEVYPVKSLQKQIKELLNNELIKNATNSSLTQTPTDDKKALLPLSKSVENIIKILKVNLKEGDITTTKAFITILSKLENQLQSKPISIQDASHQLQPKAISIQDASHQLQPKAISMQDVSHQLQQKQTSIQDTLQPLQVNQISLQETIQQLTPHLVKSTLGESKNLLDALVKILNVEKINPKEIKTMIEPLKTAMGKVDVLFSKDTNLILDKLATLNTPQKLSPDQNIKEIISNDLKAVLLKTTDEISKSSHPNQNELLKHIDKLTLAIDYHQLLSHLSNASSIYLPFSWDAMQEGNISIKKLQDNKFYCDIELKLQEYGELKVRLVLYEKNQVNIQIHSDNNEFKNIIKDNISSLRSALIDLQITPREIRIMDSSKKHPTSSYNDSDKDINMGFEVKA